MKFFHALVRSRFTVHFVIVQILILIFKQWGGGGIDWTERLITVPFAWVIFVSLAEAFDRYLSDSAGDEAHGVREGRGQDEKEDVPQAETVVVVKEYDAHPAGKANGNGGNVHENREVKRVKIGGCACAGYCRVLEMLIALHCPFQDGACVGRNGENTPLAKSVRSDPNKCEPDGISDKAL